MTYWKERFDHRHLVSPIFTLAIVSFPNSCYTCFRFKQQKPESCRRKRNLETFFVSRFSLHFLTTHQAWWSLFFLFLFFFLVHTCITWAQKLGGRRRFTVKGSEPGWKCPVHLKCIRTKNFLSPLPHTGS